MRVLGVDGCPGGWAVAELDVDLSRVVAIRREASIDTVIGAVAAGEFAVAAIDMPIGLPDDGARSCDREALRLLGRGCTRCRRQCTHGSSCAPRVESSPRFRPRLDRKADAHLVVNASTTADSRT